MKTINIKRYLNLFALAFFALLIINITGCNKNDEVTSAGTITDDEYLKGEAVQSTDGSNNDDNEILGTQTSDFEDGGAVFNNDNTALTGYDSLKFYGRRITSVTVTTTFTTNTDSMKSLMVKRAISGNFIVKGYIGGVLDSISKPYTEEQYRTATFKRVANTNFPRRNWRLYQVSAVDGQTTAPQQGKSNITMSKIEIYTNGTLFATLTGPDFTQNVFTTRYFNGSGIISIPRNSTVNVKVYATSNQSDTDIVAFHWARNTFGFHRIPFTMTSQIVNGSNFDRVYEKTFTVYGNHRFGVFNSYISANTKQSIWSNSTSVFSSTYMGLPYRTSF